MKKKKIEKEEKRQSKIWLFIKKLLAVFISGFIVVMFFLEEPGLKAFAPVLLGLYIVWVFLFCACLLFIQIYFYSKNSLLRFMHKKAGGELQK